tara:strand:+ start:1351 stop:1764 length:414 start_codon:yes stop_codon:yes gene_type:complete
MNTNKDVLLKDLPFKKSEFGNLFVFDYEKDLGKIIKRSFLVNCSEKSHRGKHAHKNLTQFLVCISGICKVRCDDGSSKKEITLDRPNKLLKIPNQIWAEQFYQEKNTSLLVMCDDIYKENDYIRDYKLFIKYREFLN